MENQERVQLVTANTYKLEHSELKRLYTYLSLFQYHYLRCPNYSDHLLFNTLEKDFKIFSAEVRTLLKKEPNNLALSKINSFFEMHYANIKRIREEMENKEFILIHNNSELNINH